MKEKIKMVVTPFKRSPSFSSTHLLAFALVFASLGSYFIFNSRAATTCDLNATTSTFASQVSAATAGQTVCLASGNYGTFSGTNKAITIAAADGATPQMTFSFGSGDSGFTLDGMTGMSGDILSGATNITIKNATFTNSTQITGSNMNVTIDSSHFDWNAVYSGGSNAKVRVDNSTSAFSGVTISNSTFRNGNLDGIHLGAGINIINNVFDNLCDTGTNHTDNIQFEGGTGGRIAGNYVHVNTCETQAITSFDGGTNGVIIENNVVDIARPWGIELYADKNSIVRHNTLVYRPDANCDFNNLACGQIDITHKSTDPVSSGTQVYDNIATDVNMSDTVGGSAHNNVSGQTAIYQGGTSPTSHDGFLLASNSPVGLNAASDGTNAGGYAIGSGTTPPPPPPPSGDTTPPTVSMTAPTNNASVSGNTVTVSATAADNIGVSGVQFKLDGANLQSEDTSSPYSVSWDSTTATNGSHTLSAVAKDAAGNSTTSGTVTVTVSNTTTPPPPPPSGTLLLGNQTIENNTDNDAAGSAEAFRYTAVASGSAATLSLYTASGSAATSVKVGVYSNNNGHPGTLLASGSFSSPASGGWNNATLSPTVSITNGTIYWIALLPTGGSVNFRNQASGNCAESNATSGLTALPGTWSNGSTWSECQTSAYILSGGSADTTAPSTPSGLTATAAAYNKVNLSWSASTDNVGVAGYYIVRDGVTISQATGTTYSDVSVNASTNYSYQVIAYDAAGNSSALSNSANVTTPAAADTTPPTTPTNLTATAVSSSQINLVWSASTDNVGVTGYDIYRNNTKIATTASTSFGNTGLSASTTYSYYVIARDAASNSSAASATVNATTQPAPVSTGNLTGTVKRSGGQGIAGATVKLTVNGSLATYTTTSNGSYSVASIPVGSYQVTYSATGYKSQTVSVAINANQTTIKNITLKRL